MINVNIYAKKENMSRASGVEGVFALAICGKIILWEIVSSNTLDTPAFFLKSQRRICYV